MTTQTQSHKTKDKELLEFALRHYGFETARHRFLMPCPFHSDSQSSLSVDLGKGVWFCFGCGQGGSGWKFIELMEGCDWKDARSRAASWGYSGSGEPDQGLDLRRAGWDTSGSLFARPGATRRHGRQGGHRPGW